jgi:SMC interacting uncharacterized protein involved in chromosome segregation
MTFKNKIKTLKDCDVGSSLTKIVEKQSVVIEELYNKINELEKEVNDLNKIKNNNNYGAGK